MKARPLRDNIFVLQDSLREDVTPSGIVITATKGIVESQKQLGREGTVVAIGPDVDPAQLRVGDRILYGEFSHPEYSENGKRYIRLSEKDVVGVIES